MNKNSIEVCYKTVTSGEKHLFIPTPKSSIIWAFIIKQNDGKYIFISHVINKRNKLILQDRYLNVYRF